MKVLKFGLVDRGFGVIDISEQKIFFRGNGKHVKSVRFTRGKRISTAQKESSC